MKIRNESTFSPRGLVRHVERSLDWINPVDLKGISFIRLMDDLPQPTDRSPHWHKELKRRYLYLNGLYVGKYKTEPAHINLYVRNLYRGIPSFLTTTSIPTLVIAGILAHEVGHHLIYTRGYVFQPTEVFKHKEIVEEICDRYAVSIVKKMMVKSRYRFSQWLVRRLAGWHLAMGSFDEGRKQLGQAAEHFLTAFHLDNNREDALYLYRRATHNGNAEQIVGPEPPPASFSSS
jgi:hypothetical protein